MEFLSTQNVNLALFARNVDETFSMIFKHCVFSGMGLGCILFLVEITNKFKNKFGNFNSPIFEAYPN